MGLGYGDSIIGDIKYSPWYIDTNFNNILYDEIMQTVSDMDFSQIAGSNVDKNNVVSNLKLMK